MFICSLSILGLFDMILFENGIKNMLVCRSGGRTSEYMYKFLLKKYYYILKKECLKNDIILAYHWSIKMYTDLPMVI
jgi:hypothetical protein